MSNRPSPRPRRQWKCPTCQTLLVEPVPGAQLATPAGRFRRTAAVVVLTALTLASGQAAIEAFDAPERERVQAGTEEVKREPADLDVDARHLGKHELEVSVMLQDGGKPVSGAAVLAFIDMPSMPLAHAKDPMPMKPVEGTPGAYVLRTKVDMVGAYDVRVEVASPKPAEGTVRVDVGAGVPQPARYPDAGNAGS